MGHKPNLLINGFSFHCCDCISVTVGQPGLEMTSKSEIGALLMNKVRFEPISITCIISPTLTQALIHKIPVTLIFSLKGRPKSRSLYFQLWCYLPGETSHSKALGSTVRIWPHAQSDSGCHF
uniref:Uncharacterized protein n=1 Tax=Pipistrellus kuhlii TaxID=59472 RepID=A0A7J7YMG4_PIPKU|nr:hypothetical protein mPipKuh1_010063 [Pipistrellus kuhlii]